jgi:hypothetical protein
MICVACYVFVHKLARSVSCCHFHRPVHPLSTTVRGHAHSPILEFSHKKVVRYFSEKRFIMAWDAFVAEGLARS